MYRKTRVKRPLLKRPKIGFQDQLSLNAGQEYCRMLQGKQLCIIYRQENAPFFNGEVEVEFLKSRNCSQKECSS